MNSVKRNCAEWKLEVDWTSYKDSIKVCLRKRPLGHDLKSTMARIEDVRRKDAKSDLCRICRQQGIGTRFSGTSDPYADYIAKSNGKFKFAPEEFYPQLLRNADELSTLMSAPHERLLFFDAEH